MSASYDRRSTFVHCFTQRGHLVARVLSPNVGQREVPIIAAEVGDAIAAMGEEAGGRVFLLDLGRVTGLSSMGLGMCVDLRNRAASSKMKAALFGATGTLLDMLKLMKIDRHYQLVADAAALDRLMA
jgi:anti-anti-sigma regulatory factor